MLLSKSTFILKRQTVEEVLVIPSLRHCSNKYKLAREGINRDKFRMKSISVERNDFSVVA